MKILFSQKSKAKSRKNKVNYVVTIFFFLFSFPSFSQEKAKDTTKLNQLDEVLVTATRGNSKTPISFSNFSKNEITKRNLGQDIPILMNFLPSVVTTSDAGNGFGYTGIRVRGSDATRVNVTINGIPYNDSESQGTYFVDMPDFASSLESIQLQRGVGTSTNGSGAFGASVNMLTQNYSEKPNAEISNSFGSFNSRKHTVKFGTGLLNEHFEIAGRFSKLFSDGYIDRAFSDLKSYFFQGAYVGKTTFVKALVFGGTERTYQAYYGIDATTLENDRTQNPIGIYTDEFGNTRYYENETDNYQQDHYQLHWNEQLSKNWNSNLAIHYTIGKGYYENYKEDADFSDYGLAPVIGQTATDLIRQKWLDNDFYGTTFSLNYNSENTDFIFGGSANKYEGQHFGKVIWARYASTSELGDRYYDDFATKTDVTIFSKLNYQVTKKINLFGDLQFRKVNYSANFDPTNLISEKFNFFNPKAGITFSINSKQNIYFSYAKANREPNRTDYENGTPKPEKLDDLELGWKYATPKIQLNINGYYMMYNDQLVLTGALDNVGNPIRTNIGKSYRLGLEVDANFKLSKKFSIKPNFTISENKNQNFVFDNGGALQDLGETDIAFSPNLIFGNIFTFSPQENLQFSILSKFVGKQYLSNIEDKNSQLKDYFIQDLSVNYQIKTKKIFQSIDFSLLANNLLDVKYVSNGADYGGGYVYYFPQAGSNFLIGMNLKF